MARITKEMRRIIRDTLDEALADAKKANYEYYVVCNQDTFEMNKSEFDEYMEVLKRKGDESSRLQRRLWDMIDAYNRIGCYYMVDHDDGDDPRYLYENSYMMEM